MDDDLKIVISTELEADEKASAQRISAQLPNISKLISKSNDIKIPVSLDESKLSTQGQKIAKRIQQTVKPHEIGVTLSNLDEGSIKKIKNAMKALDVSPDISRAMTEQLDQICVQIDKISAKWDTVAGKEEKALTVSLNGTDQLGRTVSYVGTYNAEMERLEEKSFAVVENLDKQRQAEEQIAAQAKKDNDSRIASLIKLESNLDSVKAKYSDINAPSAIKNQDSLDALNSKYL